MGTSNANARLVLRAFIAGYPQKNWQEAKRRKPSRSGLEKKHQAL